MSCPPLSCLSIPTVWAYASSFLILFQVVKIGFVHSAIFADRWLESAGGKAFVALGALAAMVLKSTSDRHDSQTDPHEGSPSGNPQGVGIPDTPREDQTVNNPALDGALLTIERHADIAKFLLVPDLIFFVGIREARPMRPREFAEKVAQIKGATWESVYVTVGKALKRGLQRQKRSGKRFIRIGHALWQAEPNPDELRLLALALERASRSFKPREPDEPPKPPFLDEEKERLVRQWITNSDTAELEKEFGLSRSVIADIVTEVAMRAMSWEGTARKYRPGWSPFWFLDGTRIIIRRDFKPGRGLHAPRNARWGYVERCLITMKESKGDLMSWRIISHENNYDEVLNFIKDTMAVAEELGCRPSLIIPQGNLLHWKAIKEAAGSDRLLTSANNIAAPWCFVHLRRDFMIKVPTYPYSVEQPEDVDARYAFLSLLSHVLDSHTVDELLRRVDLLIDHVGAEGRYQTEWVTEAIKLLCHALPEVKEMIWCEEEHPGLKLPRDTNPLENSFSKIKKRFKKSGGFKSETTAPKIVDLVIGYYRLCPFSKGAKKEHREKSPLQLASANLEGWELRAEFRFLLHPPSSWEEKGSADGPDSQDPEPSGRKEEDPHTSGSPPSG